MVLTLLLEQDRSADAVQILKGVHASLDQESSNPVLLVMA